MDSAWLSISMILICRACYRQFSTTSNCISQDYHIVRDGEFARQPRVTAWSRRTWNDIIISLSFSKRAGAAASRRIPQTCLSRHYHTYSACYHYVIFAHRNRISIRRHALVSVFEVSRNWYQTGSETGVKRLLDGLARETHTRICTRRCQRDYRRRYPYHVPARSYRDGRRGEFKKQLAHAA